jgi:hypothetical protein
MNKTIAALPGIALLVCLGASCVPHAGSGPDPVQAIQPGQALTVQLPDKSVAQAIAGQRYRSALGEDCVRVSYAGQTDGRGGSGGSGLMCLRAGVWTQMPDIFAAQPGSVTAGAPK